MNKKDRFLSLMVHVSKRLPTEYDDIDDPRNEILIYMPPMSGFPKGKFFVRKAGLFVIQQNYPLKPMNLIEFFLLLA